jgi:hypothetical protein
VIALFLHAGKLDEGIGMGEWEHGRDVTRTWVCVIGIKSGGVD